MPTKLLTVYKELGSGICLPLVSQLHARFAKNMAQELNMVHAKVALRWFEPDVELH